MCSPNISYVTVCDLTIRFVQSLKPMVTVINTPANVPINSMMAQSYRNLTSILNSYSILVIFASWKCIYVKDFVVSVHVYYSAFRPSHRSS